MHTSHLVGSTSMFQTSQQEDVFFLHIFLFYILFFYFQNQSVTDDRRSLVTLPLRSDILTQAQQVIREREVLQCVPTVNMLIEELLSEVALDRHISPTSANLADVTTVTLGELHFIVQVERLT